ncbi:MAG: biotin/lipoyl-containing protein [Armatimonadota bacterium]|nr:biotin/lipoyl-containing protein [Armatimonadota bacterium]MDR7421097.1 biotin/lipoyl-containing protein [Armatimonadota bacterium]MDR7453229.1 biotin/lipoyl-containing protein [Armatimonadota bacterium]MDR7455846.1 biotin/lipoyl-containing protein [Armatimonadota bacterium]MDR7497087.1 biotin/lipoyl-containing protein [Armatimonadota bacterium]
MTARGVRLAFGDDVFEVELLEDAAAVTARCAGREITVSVVPLGGGAYAVVAGGRRRVVHYATDGTTALLQLDGHVYGFRLAAGGPAPPRTPAHQQDLRAPMPGQVTRVYVDVGQEVAPGDPLFAVEAMKMEHVVRASAAGRVTRVRATPGARVDAGELVVEVAEVEEGR